MASWVPGKDAGRDRADGVAERAWWWGILRTERDRRLAKARGRPITAANLRRLLMRRMVRFGEDRDPCQDGMIHFSRLLKAGKGTELSDQDFQKRFEELTGNPPFPWQVELYRRFVDGVESIPARCDIPTGLGKTSVIAIWLLARDANRLLPRRLVYVVNRRTVVDQTTSEVERYRSIRPQLAISTLRGQFADNREWSADPSREAVICGTVDMIGSRLLFSGYGVGFKGRPLHAGFLGQDTLIVHDEAHLEPAFQNLLAAIEKEQTQGRFPDWRPLRVMALSATSHQMDDGHDSQRVLKLESADLRHDTVKHRIHAVKSLVRHKINDERQELADRLVTLALAHKDSGRAVLIFVRTVDDLGKVVGKLPKGQTCQLTGTMRGHERDRLVNPRDVNGSPIFARFLPPPKPDAPDHEQWKVTSAEGTVYLACTSAGEVGVNISADHLVCDLSTFESMAQRFGRVNRFGRRDDTRIDVVCPSMFNETDSLTPARRKTLALLESLKGDASPAALGNLDPQARLDAFAPTPTVLETSDILFDAWSMTSIRGKLPGRPQVAPYLHGIAQWEPAQTKVAWRSEVGEITGDHLDENPPEDLLDDFPIKPHELLTDRSDRIFNTLKKLSPVTDVPAWVIGDEGEVTVTTLAQIVAGDRKAVERVTLLLPPQAGGLENGFFGASAKFNPDIPYDVADAWAYTTGAMRVREWTTGDADNPRTPKGMKPVRRIVFKSGDDDDAKIIKTWHWFVRILATDADARGREPYPLQPHLDDAKAAAMRFVADLPLDDEHRRVIILACGFHDLGKDRDGWQRGIGNLEYPATKWAKSGRRQNRPERSKYRHEFGSVLDVQAQPIFDQLSIDAKDLLLHLIAAHHGRARPHFGIDESFDGNHSQAADALAVETPRRFARLQRRYGRWGLAYLESLVRAADYAASQKAEGGEQ